MSLKNRTTLQYAFQNGRVPNGQDFADLIDSFINQLDDNISMTERKTAQVGNPSLNTSLSVGATWSILSGKVELTKDSSTLKGYGTRFREQLVKGQEIIITNEHYFVSEITDNENLVLNKQAAADLKDASARAIPDIFAVQDAQQNVLLYISRDGKIGIGKIPQTGLDIHGNMTSDGTIQAVKFSGDGSLLTKLDPRNINGIIPAEHLPPVNVNEITGLLTVSNLFNHAIAGTFSGDEGQPMITGTQDFAAEKLQEGQFVKMGEDVYEISRIINQSLIFKTNIAQRAEHVTLYTAGKFLEMNLNGKSILYINSSGDLYTKGAIDAKSFKGDGSQLTNITAGEVKGKLSLENLPEININDINGKLTVNESFSHAMAGTVSEKSAEDRKEGEENDMLTVSGDFPITQLFAGQQIKVGNYKYEVREITEDQGIQVDPALKESIQNETVFMAGNLLELKTDGRSKLLVEPDGNLFVQGKVDAKTFKGDASNLTNIPAGEVKGKLALENMPEINVNDINGKLTVNETFSHAMAGTVSGIDVAEGEKNDLLTVSADFPITQLFAGQQIKVGNYKYMVREITEDQKILLDSELKESIQNETVFMAGNLLELKTDGRSQLLVEPDGNLFVQGNIDAKTFKGDASNLTNIPAKEIDGIISSDNLPPVHISEITGLLTIQATEGSNFLDLKNHDGNSLANINSKGDFHTDGNINASGNISAANLTGNAAGLTNIPANQIQGVIPSEHIPQELNGQLTIHGDLHTDGKVSASNLEGNAAGLFNIPADKINGVIPSEHIPQELNGQLTIHGDLHTDGKVSAANLEGNAAGLFNIPAGKINGVIPSEHIPQELNGQLTIHGDLHTDGKVSAANLEGNAAGLFNIPADKINGVIPSEHIPQDLNGPLAIHGNISATYFTGDGGGLTNIPADRIQGLISPDHLPHDLNGPLLIHSRDAFFDLKNQEQKSVMHINNEGSIQTDGSVEAKYFKGDGSQLTNLPTSGSSNHVQGMLTIDRAFDISGDSTVSGNKDDEKLKLQGLFPRDMFIGQEIKIVSNRYRVVSMEGTKLGIKPGLAESVSNEKIYSSGNFIEMNIEQTNRVNISYNGDVHTAGTIDARGGFVGNAAGLNNIPAKEIQGVLAPDRIPSTVNISQTNGSFTVHGMENKGFLALKNSQGQEVTKIDEKGDLRTKGEVHADGKISAGIFEGNASQLFDIPADRIKGVIPIANIPTQQAYAPRVTFYADRPVKEASVEFVTLFWATNDVDFVELQYMEKGDVVINKTPAIPLQGSIRTSFYQTTTVTLTATKEGRTVDQKQITITVIQSPALYMKQLKFEGFPAAYAIEMTVKRFALNILTDENLKILVSALQRVSYPLEECYLHVPQLYRNYKQNWKPEVHGVFMQTLLSIQ